MLSWMILSDSRLLNRIWCAIMRRRYNREEREAARLYISQAFERHCKELHNADFEVCEDEQCRCAVELERILDE